MSKKKVTAPLSYDPGKGRPQEYLAYLNWQEMQALQRLNGGNMERGPRGLPSFPPSDAMDPNDNQTTGTGNWTGAPGSGTTSGGAGGTTGGGSDSGSVTGGTTTGTTASSSAAGAQQASADAEAQQTAAERSAAEAARSSALAEDARKSGIASINVGPMSTPVKIGSGKISQIVKAPETNLKVMEDFYRSDPYYKSALDNLRKQQEKYREPVVRSDSAKIARESDPYNFMTDYEKETLLNKYSPSNILSSASNAVSYVYNNPLDAATGVIKSALAPAAIAGQYLLGEKSALDDSGNFTEGAVNDLTNAALSYGVGTGVASLASPAPAGSVGAFVGARVSTAPEIRRAINYAEGITDKYSLGSLTPEQIKDIERSIYDKTSRMVSQDVSGIQYMRPSQAWATVDPWSNPAIEIAQNFTPKVSGIGAPKKYSDVFEKGPVNYFVPQIEDLNIISDKKLVTDVDPNLGYYNKSGVYDPYPGVTGGIRQIYDMATGSSGFLPGPGVSINTFDPSVLARYNQSVDKLARHEIGVHYMSDISGGLYGPGTVAGPDYWKSQISDTAPTASPSTVRELSWSTYQDALEEQAARKAEETNYANQLWRNYANRFSYFSPEEMADAEAARVLGEYYERNR